MTLPYTNETVTSPDGISCRVLDTAKVDFNNAVSGKKITPTLIFKANGGEQISTRDKFGVIESSAVANEGDAIFVNSAYDMYLPWGDAPGTHWQFSELEARGYRIVSPAPFGDGVIAVNDAAFPILHEIITEPTCIMQKGTPQFCFNGASLKRNDNGSVTAIAKTAFDSTWAVLPAPKV